MGQSWQYLRLDTTGPSIEKYAPVYTTTDILTEIVIESDEPLSGYQEIYFIDSQGIRHDLSFLQKDAQTLEGAIIFGNYNTALGIGTLYAKVEDSAGNISDITTKTIEIKENIAELRLEVGCTSFKTNSGTIAINSKKGEFVAKNKSDISIIKTVSNTEILKSNSDTRGDR
jgi:hypothetical protein